MMILSNISTHINLRKWVLPKINITNFIFILLCSVLLFNLRLFVSFLYRLLLSGLVSNHLKLDFIVCFIYRTMANDYVQKRNSNVACDVIKGDGCAFRLLFSVQTMYTYIPLHISMLLLIISMKNEQ